MLKDHQFYLEWNGDRFCKWVERIGENAVKVIEAIVCPEWVEKQSYETCMVLLKLADKYLFAKSKETCKTTFLDTQSPKLQEYQKYIVGLKSKWSWCYLWTTMTPSETTAMVLQKVLFIIGGHAHDKQVDDR